MLDWLRGKQERPVPQPSVRIDVSVTSGSPPGYSSPYLPSEQWDSLLRPRPDGFPPFRLVQRDDSLWLAEEQTGLLVNVANRKLRALGLWSGTVKGASYHGDHRAIARSTLHFVREPTNPHDKNAVAVWAGNRQLGHVNKQMAAGLARDLDAGAELVVMSFGGLRWVAGSPAVMQWLSVDDRVPPPQETRGRSCTRLKLADHLIGGSGRRVSAPVRAALRGRCRCSTSGSATASRADSRSARSR